MHAVNIGIGGYDDLVVAQGVEPFLDVEGCLKKIELLILIDYLLGESEGIEGFSAQREDCLGVDITALGDAAAG